MITDRERKLPEESLLPADAPKNLCPMYLKEGTSCRMYEKLTCLRRKTITVRCICLTLRRLLHCLSQIKEGAKGPPGFPAGTGERHAQPEGGKLPRVGSTNYQVPWRFGPARRSDPGPALADGLFPRKREQTHGRALWPVQLMIPPKHWVPVCSRSEEMHKQLRPTRHSRTFHLVRQRIIIMPRKTPLKDVRYQL